MSAYANIAYGQEIQNSDNQNHWVIWNEGSSACPIRQVLGLLTSNPCTQLFTVDDSQFQFGDCDSSNEPTVLLDSKGTQIVQCTENSDHINCSGSQHDIIKHGYCVGSYNAESQTTESETETEAVTTQTTTTQAASTPDLTAHQLSSSPSFQASLQTTMSTSPTLSLYSTDSNSKDGNATMAPTNENPSAPDYHHVSSTTIAGIVTGVLMGFAFLFFVVWSLLRQRQRRKQQRRKRGNDRPDPMELWSKSELPGKSETVFELSVENVEELPAEAKKIPQELEVQYTPQELDAVIRAQRLT